MCGIAGVISLKKDEKLGVVHSNRLDHMLMRIRDRGPDGYGVDREDDYIIGSVRLKIVGGEQGRQPIKEKKLGLVFNGEIYNYNDLCKKSGITNVSSDTFALFQLLRTNSINIFSALNGVFAFCFITSTSIYLVRDRFGEKPLFYMVHEGALYFASEMKAFLDFIDFNITLSENYMSLETEIAQKTIFDNIFQIEAGCYLEVDRKRKRITKKRYYTFIPQSQDNKSEKQLIEELRFLVIDAINIRTNTEKTIAVYASGGIDSSIIALLSKPQYIFSFLPKSKIVPDEEHYVDILASKMNNTKLIKVSNGKNSFLEHFIDMVYMNDGPTTTFGSFAQYFLARESKNHAVKITLSGIGADEFFNGYVRHAIATLPHIHFNSSLFKKYKTLIKKSGVIGKSISTPVAYGNLLSRNGAPDVMLQSQLTKIFFEHKSSLTAISMSDALFTLPPLLHTDDYINMGFSIENRSPFMDYRLAEFALSMAENYKIRVHKKSNEISTKYLLRRAFKDILPKQIYNRKDKVGLTSNVAELLREQMRYVFLTSYRLLHIVFPHHPYLLSVSKDLLGQYSRWEYQISQLAITYLLFTKRYTKKDVYEHYMRQANN